MTNSPNVLIGKVFNIAKNAHNGQFRRDGVTPYFKHPMDVADRVHHLGHEYVCVAYLHDIFEDTKVTYSDLEKEGIPENILKAVEILTKSKDIIYDEYLHSIKCNELARQVKIADMISNLSDHPTEKQIRKYAKGLLFLIDV
jgi:(p)ppGpp synthase/HD superfamily hydrolase